MSEPSTSPVLEPFTPAVKACRDVLVDDVKRHLGIPIVGELAPLATITVHDIEQARRDLARAIAGLERDPQPAGPHVKRPERCSRTSQGCSAPRAALRTSPPCRAASSAVPGAS